MEVILASIGSLSDQSFLSTIPRNCARVITPPQSVINASFAELLSAKSPKGGHGLSSWTWSWHLIIHSSASALMNESPLSSPHLSGSYGLAYVNEVAELRLLNIQQRISPSILFEIAETFHIVWSLKKLVDLSARGRPRSAHQNRSPLCPD